MRHFRFLHSSTANSQITNSPAGIFCLYASVLAGVRLQAKKNRYPLRRYRLVHLRFMTKRITLRHCVSDLGNEFGDQITVKGFGAAFTADTTVLDTAKRCFRQGHAKVIDVDHASLDFIGRLVRRL